MQGLNFKTINDAALRVSRSLLPQIVPGGKFRSLEYIVRNPRRDDQHAGSFKINYRTGLWKDFATGDGGGDLISLLAYVRGCTQGDAARELAAKVGISGAETVRRARQSECGEARRQFSYASSC